VIRALVVVNNDGHIIRRSILGLPEKAFLHTGVQELCSESLIMYTMMQIPTGKPPMCLGEVSCKSLVAENDEKLASMAANLVTKDEVGDITVLACRTTLDAMDYIGMAYELDVLYPTDTAEIPANIIEGRTKVDEDIVDDGYTLSRYEQTVTDATDSQIADAIAGMETFFNEQDRMDDRDRTAVNKIASSVARLNAALERCNRHSDLDSYDDGRESDIGEELDIDEELDCIWDAQTEMAKQIGDTLEMLNGLQSKFIEFIASMNTKAELDNKLANKVNMVNGRVDLTNNAMDELRNQLGNAIAESLQPHKPKRPWVLYILLGISLVMNLINLLL